MSDVLFSMVERKNLKLLVSPATPAHAAHAALVKSLAATIRSVSTDLPVVFHVAEKFRKFGEKEQTAQILNVLPEFAESGLDPAFAHIAVNGERAAAKADKLQQRLADAAVQAVAHFMDVRDGRGLHFDARFSWVPYASLMAVSHPVLANLESVHHIIRKSVPFPDRYISMALERTVSMSELAAGKWNRSEVIQLLVHARQRHQAHPIMLPLPMDVIRSEALRSLAEAKEIPLEAAWKAASRPYIGTLPEVGAWLAGLGERKVSIGDILQRLGSEGFGLALLALTLPNLGFIPSIPVLPFVCGLPAMLLCLQACCGYTTLRLPRTVSRLSMRADRALRMMRILNPLSAFSRARLTWMTQGLGLRVCGVVAFVLTFVTCLPVPILNIMPAFGLACLALGIAERDGLMVLGGVAVGCAGAVLMGVLGLSALAAFWVS